MIYTEHQLKEMIIEINWLIMVYPAIMKEG